MDDIAGVPIRTARRSSLTRRSGSGGTSEAFANSILTEGPTGVVRDVAVKSKPGRIISVIDEELPGSPGLNFESELNPVQDKKRSPALDFLESVANSVWFSTLVGICTIYSLFASDLRLAFTDVTADPIFGAVAAVVMSIFIMELVLNCCISGRQFVASFQFWLDLVSVMAMVADVPWIFDPILGDTLDSDVVDNLTVARAGRVSKLATRAARIGRIFRVVRLLRLTAISQFAFSKPSNNQVDPTGESIDAIQEELRARRRSSTSASAKPSSAGINNNAANPVGMSLLSEMTEGSAIGRKLSELTTMRVIMIVLLIIMVLPYFDVTQADEPVSVALQRIEAESDGITRQLFISSLVKSSRVSLLYLSVGEGVYISKPLTNYRSSEVDFTEETFSAAIEDIRYQVQAQSIANLELMAFTVFILGAGALLFSRDAQVLVIGPIERMVQFVRKLASNPLEVVDMSTAPDEKQLRLETQLLESTLVKLGCLLQIGFGSAGASIIAKNFKDHGRVLNPMLPGSRVNAVFAFCDIRRFTDTTECLQESVMIFVNEVANIVHGCCQRLGGAANKNIGDAFFIVWKLSNDENEIRNPKNGKYIADQSIIAFVHCVAELLTSPQLQRWRDDKRITDRIPGYNINLGVGIHWGWAIEGAIGTEQKIDASYLSPHVEMSQTLEELTKVYGVPILFSGEVYDTLSPQLQSMCRILDTVQQRASKTPLRVYTFDIGGEALELQKKQPSMPSSLNRGSISLKEPHSSVIKRLSIIASPNISESSIDHDAVSTADDKSDDYVLIDMVVHVKPYRVGIDSRWVDMYNKAVKAYLNGDWTEAKALLHSCSTIVPDDRPTKFLMEYLETHGPAAPADWPGYRIANDKH